MSNRPKKQYSGYSGYGSGGGGSAGSVSISGFHYVYHNPATVQAWIDDANADGRMFRDTAGFTGQLYISPTGNDNATGLDAAHPILTFNEVERRFAVESPDNNSIHRVNAAAGTYVWNPTTTQLSQVLFVGPAPTVLDTRLITVITQNSLSLSIILVLGGGALALWHVGMLVRFADGLRGTIVKIAGNVVTVTYESLTAQPVIVAGVDSLVLEDPAFIIDTNGQTVSTQACVNLQFQFAKFTNGGLIFPAAGCQILAFYCVFDNISWRAVQGSPSSLRFECCGWLVSGDGVLLRGGAMFYLEAGTTLDFSTYDAGDVITSDPHSFCRFTGEVAIVGADSWHVNNAQIARGEQARDCIRAVAATGTAVFAFNSGGHGDLPPVFTVTNTPTWQVTATEDAQVSCDASSTLKAVSADGGTTATSSNLDGTLIVNGTPTGGLTLLAGVPADAALTTATGERTVFGSMTLTADATHAATITIAIETGVGTGAYQPAIVATNGAAGVVPLSMPYSFFVPAGRRYSFTKTVGGVSTAVVNTHNYNDR